MIVRASLAARSTSAAPIRPKYRLRYDDALDVVAVHGVGGVVGLARTGLTRTGRCVTTRPRAGPARLWSYTRRDQRER
jgi:ammonia channel protein AmtB